MKTELGEPLSMAELLTTAQFLVHPNKTFQVLSILTPASHLFTQDKAWVLVIFSGEIFLRSFILRRDVLDSVLTACEEGKLEGSTFYFEAKDGGVKAIKIP